jgi:DNA-binding transcriptional MerR regulator
MTIIALLSIHSHTSAMHTQHDKLFEESQLIRMRALSSLKEAGLSLLNTQELLKDATEDKPARTDMGEFTSFNNYLDTADLPFKRSAAYNYIKLANNWDVVEALGMQSKDSKNIHKSLRLCRTLKVIEWYNKKVAAGVDPNTLSFDLYWKEQEKPDGPSKKDLLLQVDALRYQLEEANTTAVPLDTYNHVLNGYQQKVAEVEERDRRIEKLETELEATRLELQQLKPKPTYKFNPPVFA